MFLPGNEHDVGNSRMLQCLKRIKDHRLIIDRQKMLIRDKCERMQARPQSSGQNDAFHIRSLYPTALLCVNAGFDVVVKDHGFFSYVANPLWVCEIPINGLLKRLLEMMSRLPSEFFLHF